MRHSKSTSVFISRRKALQVLLAAVLLMLILALIAVVRRCGFIDKSQPEESSYAVENWIDNTKDLNLIEQYAVENDCYITGDKIRISGIMLHSVGSAQPSAKAYASSFNTFNPNGSEVCPHAFIQSDGTVYQLLPWDMKGWHAGGSANSSHIGLEMCESSSIVYIDDTQLYAEDESAVEYTRNTYEAAARLCAALCIRYELDPLESGVIISHSEGNARGMASAHHDPEHLWDGLGLDYSMDSFRLEVAAIMKTMKK